MSRVELPSGAWVELRDPEQLRNRDRKRIVVATEDAGESLAAKGFAGMDAMLAVLVSGWSYESPLPGENPDALDDLPVADYDALTEAAKPAMHALFPNFAAGNDPASPPSLSGVSGL